MFQVASDMENAWFYVFEKQFEKVAGLSAVVMGFNERAE